MRILAICVLLIAANCTENKTTYEDRTAKTSHGKTAKGKQTGKAKKATLTPLEQADKVWKSCQGCHGLNGTGNGEMAYSLSTKPRDFTDEAWQASVTAEQIRKVIVGGGVAIGKSKEMKPNPKLANKAEVLGLLVTKVRAFRTVTQ